MYEEGGFTIDPRAIKDVIERKDLNLLREKFDGFQGVATKLKCDLEHGIKTVEVSAREAYFGRNELPPPKEIPFLARIWEALKDNVMRLLIICSIVSIILGMTLPDPHTQKVERDIGWIEGTAILISVALVVFISAFNDHQKAKKFAELSKSGAQRYVDVLRDGKKTHIRAEDVVVGDVLFIELGQSMSCDGLLFEAQDLLVDESSSTGESDHVKKRVEGDIIMMSGSAIVEGHGKCVVVAVGCNSFYGDLLMKARDQGEEDEDDEEDEKKDDKKDKKGKKGEKENKKEEKKSNTETETDNSEREAPKEEGKSDAEQKAPPSLPKNSKKTPLQKKLDVLAKRIGYFGMTGAVITFIILCLKNIVEIVRGKEKFNIVNYLKYLIVGITVIVVAIPEGLPLAVTIALAYGMKAMLKDNCLVRILASCETMGGCSAICSDKTGTLTQNKMTVVQGWIASEDFLIADTGCVGWEGSTPLPRVNPEGNEMRLKKVTGQVLRFLNECVCLNSTAEEHPNQDGKMVWGGNKTEEGLLTFVNRTRSYKEARAQVSPDHRRTYPFSSSKKRMTTVVRTADNRFLIYVKGASELVLEDCNTYMTPEGERATLTGDLRSELQSRILHMANQGNRTIAVAFTEDIAHPAFYEEEPNFKLCLVALLAMQDPIRPEVPLAVEQCKSAGITVRMVTGDNINTAIAIAKKCGIYENEKEHVAMTGADFSRMFLNDTAAFQEMLPRLRVVARSSPTDKRILVEQLMAQGSITAVTGDGTNDAPALKRADVGFAMFDGTEVAKNSSEMILMDNNFATVVKATMWGRTVNDNVRKFLNFQLTINVVGVALTLIGSAVLEKGQEPLSPVQLLWLNLIMDTFAAVALATEQPHISCLNRKPYLRGGPLISRCMWAFILLHGVFQLAVTLVLLFKGQDWFQTGKCTVEDEGKDMAEKYAHVANCRGSVTHRTVIFNVFIFLQLINQFNSRVLFPGQHNLLRGLHKTPQFFIIFMVEIGFQIFAVEVAGKFMSTTPLTVFQWLGCIAIALLELPVGVIIRLIMTFIREKEPENQHPA